MDPAPDPPARGPWPEIPELLQRTCAAVADLADGDRAALERP